MSEQTAVVEPVVHVEMMERSDPKYKSPVEKTVEKRTMTEPKVKPEQQKPERVSEEPKKPEAKEPTEEQTDPDPVEDPVEKPVIDEVEEETEKPEEKTRPHKSPSDIRHEQKRWNDLLQREAYYRAQVEILQRQQTQPQQQQPVEDRDLPSRAAYTNDEDYVHALVKYEREKERVIEQQQTQARAQQEALDKFNQKQVEAKAAYDDYDEVIGSASVDNPLFMTNRYPHVTETVMTSEYGTDLMYYLASNPDESVRIARMTPIAAVNELGRIQGYIERALTGKETVAGAKEPVTVTTPEKPRVAPTPYKTPRGTGGAGKKSIYDKDLTTKERIEMFNKL
jgi:hypothetical protein